MACPVPAAHAVSCSLEVRGGAHDLNHAVVDEGLWQLSAALAQSDGTTAIELSPSVFVERLSAIIPPPRARPIIYRGVLAANAAWRVTSSPIGEDADQDIRLVPGAPQRRGRCPDGT